MGRKAKSRKQRKPKAKTVKVKVIKKSTDPLELMFTGESTKEYNSDYQAAEIPEWRGNYDPAKDDSNVVRETKIWNPVEEEEEKGIPWFTELAKATLTAAQMEQGISGEDALTNVSSDSGKQYIWDVLHDSEYTPGIALRRLFKREVPRKFTDPWMPREMTLFQEGLRKYKKNFGAIRSNLLAHRTTMEIVEFYYNCKREKQAKRRRASKALKRGQKKPESLIIGPMTSSGPFTRSKAAKA